MKNICSKVLILTTVILAACGAKPTPQPSVVTAPAIMVQITEDDCPSIEASVGVQIVWTNEDTTDHALIIQHLNDAGQIVDAGGTDLLQPGDFFSTTFMEAGEYTYYCSIDQTTFGMITITP
jgi:plastocyanin